MALNQSALDEIAAMLKSGDSFDLVRRAVEFVFQELIEAEAAARIGAERYERTETRTNERNGHRERTLSTKAGDLTLKIPKVRQGSFFPSILEPRRRIDQALYAVVMEAYVKGVSTRSVDELVEALGIESGISRSEVSRICAALDEQVQSFFSRRLDHARFPYVLLDATYLHVREDHKVIGKAVVIATGINDQGVREVLGMAVGDSEEEAFWGPFLSGLRSRGLSGVQLVISDQHAGLVAAIRRHLQGAAHQRCRVHAVRNLLTHVPKASQEMVAAAFRTIFAQASPEEVSTQWDVVRDSLASKFDKAAKLMDGAKEEVLAFSAFPKEHWRQIWSTNSLERLNKELKRRCRVVGIFPNEASVMRLAGSVLIDAHDEWQASERRYFSLESMAKLAGPGSTPVLTESP